MYRLKLVKAKSYWGIVKASEKNPFVEVESKETADTLIASGYFNMADGAAEVLGGDTAEDEESEAVDIAEEDEPQGGTTLVEIQKKSKAELVEYAGRNGIDITGCKTKDDIQSRIIEMIAKAAAAREALREE